MGAPIHMNMGQQPMNTDFLTLTQLLSPAFPVGAFAYSHGVEAAVEAQTITSAATLEAWLSDLVQMGSGRADAVLVNIAYETAPDDLAMLDAQARAFAASAERLRETDLQGAAFCDTVKAVWDLDLPQLCYPVAIGHVARAMSLDVELTTAVYLQAFVSNLTAAAMRLVPLGQVDGQKVQTALKPKCAAVASALKGATLADLHSNTWLSDIAAMQHETQYSRIFRT